MPHPEFHKKHTLPGVPAQKETTTPEPVPKQIGSYTIEGLFREGGMSLLLSRHTSHHQ